MSAFVVCPKCGTRIKAGREFCLRCFEPLPDPNAEVARPVWESLGLSRSTEMMIAGGAAVAVVALGLFIWMTQPARVDDEAHPLNGVPTAATAQLPAPGGSPSSGDATAALAPPDAAAAPVETDPALEATRAAYEQRLEARPNDPDLQNKLGQLLMRMGKTDEAVKPLEKAVTQAPRNAAYRTSLAQAASALGQRDRAVDQFREAARLLPGDYAAWYALAMSLQKKGDDQTAIPEFQKAKRYGPKEPGALLGLAISLEKVGRGDEAVPEYQHFLDLAPPSAEVERVKAHLALLSHGRPQVK